MFSNDYFVDGQPAGGDKPLNQSNIHKSTKFKYKQHVAKSPKTTTISREYTYLFHSIKRKIY